MWVMAPTHWEGVGQISSQGGTQDYGQATSVRELWCLVILPTGGRDGRGGNAGGGDLHIPPPEHGHTVYCDQAHYGPVSGSRTYTVTKGVQSVVEIGRGGCGGDADSGLGHRTDGGGGGCG